MSTVPKRSPWARARGRLEPVVRWAMSNWPGRILVRTGAGIVRLELFDRSMTLAAQLFTSVFPLLIMAAVVFGQRFRSQLADMINLPEGTRRVLDEALSGSGFSAFGVFGALIVLVSSTSLARTLIRAYAAIWRLPRHRRGVRAAWRLLAAVLLLTFAVVAVRVLIRFTDALPTTKLATPVLTLAADSALALAIPWILLAGALPFRLLAPGAVLFGMIMLAVRPAGSVYLPHALRVSADRYGTIGLAFTYIGWLYILSFCYLGAAIAGQVLAADEGRLGQVIRGGPGADAPSPP